MNIVTNTDKSKYLYSGYRVAFEGQVHNNEFARNVIIFGVDNSSSSHAYNNNNSFFHFR